MKYIKLIIPVLAVSVFLFACNGCKKDDPVDIGGKGGTSILKITPQHHGKNIDSCTVFIKYNTQELPSAFDEQVVCIMENGKPVGTFTELKKGKYYIYGDGWDPNIQQRVVGGIPYTITEESTTYNITVPVTEGDH